MIACDESQEATTRKYYMVQVTAAASADFGFMLGGLPMRCGWEAARRPRG